MPLNLSHGLTFADLYRREGLIKLDAAFHAHLSTADAALADRLTAGRTNAYMLTKKDESALILDLAPHLDRFISQLFGINDEVLALTGRHDELAPLYSVKRQFVQRKAHFPQTREQQPTQSDIRHHPLTLIASIV